MGAIHDNLVQSLINFRNKYLKASDGLIFRFTKDTVTGKYGYTDGNGNFHPFKTAHTLTKSITAETSTSTTDMGEDHEYRYVSIAPTPSQSKTASSSTSDQTISPDAGNLLSSVTISAISPQRTAGTAVTTSGTDSGGPYVYFPYGWYPNYNTNYGCYVRMTQAQAQAAHSHTATTGTRTVNGTWDIGEKHSYRYISINVANSFASTFSNVAASTYEKGSGQTITETYKATSAGDYLVIAWGYAYDDTSTVSLSITSTGTLLGYQNTKTTGNYRTFTCNVRIFRLAANQTITTGLGSAQHGRGRVILKIK